MQKNKKVTVILISYYGDQWIPRCIDTLRQASIHTIRLLVVNNEGNSCIDDIDLSDFDATILRCSTTLGFAEANNFALVNGGLENEFVCFLNQDTLSGKGWLDACLECMNKNGKVGALSPLIANYIGQSWDQNFVQCCNSLPGFSKYPNAIIKREPKKGGFHSVAEIPAVAMVVRSSVLVKIGPFDPIFGSYCEDYDLCDRIRKYGYEVGICTDGIVRHFSGSGITSHSVLRLKARQSIRNRLILGCRRRVRGRKTWVIKQITIEMMRRLARSFFRYKQGQPLSSVLLAWFDVLVLLPRLMSAYTDANSFRRDLYKSGWITTKEDIQDNFKLNKRTKQSLI